MAARMQEREARQLQMMTTQLSLTDDQQASVKQVFADRDAKMGALFGNQSLSQEDRRSQMMALRQDSETKIRAVLTPEQQPKYDDMMAQMRQRMGGRGGNGQGGYGQGGNGGGNGGGNPPTSPPPQQ
jgi:protein CpxP